MIEIIGNKTDKENFSMYNLIFYREIDGERVREEISLWEILFNNLHSNNDIEERIKLIFSKNYFEENLDQIIIN